MVGVIEHIPDLMTIGELSRITGVNSVTLRAWERRHGLLQPERNHQGHRYYRKSHFDEVQEILKWLERGYSISKVSPILRRRSESAFEASITDVWESYRRQLDSAARSLNQRVLDRVVNDLIANYPIDTSADRVVLPWLDKWIVDHRGGLLSGIPFYFALDFLRMRLHHRLFQLDRSGPGDEKVTVVFASLSDARYDAHFYLYANLLADFNYDVVPLHASATIADLPQQSEATQAKTVVLFANNVLDTAELASLQRSAARFVLPVAMFGDAMQMQLNTFNELPFDCITDTGSLAIRAWVMRQGEKA